MDVYSTRLTEKDCYFMLDLIKNRLTTISIFSVKINTENIPLIALVGNLWKRKRLLCEYGWACCCLRDEILMLHSTYRYCLSISVLLSCYDFIKMYMLRQSQLLLIFYHNLSFRNAVSNTLRTYL